VGGAPFPIASGGARLGVGMDLSWGHEAGWTFDPERGDRVADRVQSYLERHAAAFSHLFVSWQPRDRARLDARAYFPAYDDLFDRVGALYPVRALHHTALNLGAIEPYDRAELFAFTNALVERYKFAWINEDLGLWSIHGKPLPYPLPPYLTREGLRAAIESTRLCMRELAAPLLVEFPGFSDDAFVVGSMHAYDFFRALADEADVAVTLDTGHLLTYQWLLGKRGEDLFGDLDRLPLARCFEIHLSGCAVSEEGDLLDLHHGVLLKEQLDLCAILLARCPNARAVTYEDPAFDERGILAPAARPGFEALQRVVRSRGAA
jgi:uncharacterized protein